MHVFLNPVPYIEDLVHVFAQGAKEPGGLVLDVELCRSFEIGLEELAEKVDALVAYVRAHGLVGGAAEARPRTPTERQLVARMLLLADPGARVVAIPASTACRAPAGEGGSAA